MANQLKICTDCYEVSFGKSKMRGHFVMEVILWFCFLIPGLIYTIWRHTSIHKVCAKCGGTVIPAESPRGKQLFKQYHMND